MKTLIHVINISVLAIALGFISTAKAERLNLDFDLINKTGWDIKAVYVSPAASDEWEENLLKSPLLDGETLEVSFSPKLSSKKWDIKIVWVDGGDSVFWRGYDLSEISKLSIYYNAKTDTTTAKAE